VGKIAKAACVVWLSVMLASGQALAQTVRLTDLEMVKDSNLTTTPSPNGWISQRPFGGGDYSNNNAREFDFGIVMLPPGTDPSGSVVAAFNLDRKYAAFLAAFGIERESYCSKPTARVSFTVLGDGGKLLADIEVHPSQPFVNRQIDVSGVATLTIRATTTSGAASCADGIVGEPSLSR
jgi:hypothetical protein